MNPRLRCCGLALSVAWLMAVPAAGSDPPERDEPRLRFTEQLVAGDYTYAFGLAAADLDGDGDLDLTSADITGKPSLSTLYCYENDGRGGFQRHVVWQGEPGWFERHAIGDINGDGRPDIAIVNNRDGHLLWFANSGQPFRGPWQRHVITTQCTRAYDVVLADLDGDSDLDAAAAGYASGLFTWYENPGPALWHQPWARRVVGDRMPEARTIGTGDFNRDGHLDLLAAAVGAANVPLDVTDARDHGCSIAWYQNPGDPAVSSWRKHMIDDRTRAPIHGHPTDLDRDGDLDVVMAVGMRDELVPARLHQVVWYEAVGGEGDESVWRKHEIGDLPYAFEAVAADLDNDRDIDVVATAWSKGDRVVWFENQGDPRSGWKLHLVKQHWHAANQVIVADLDGDQRPDLAATADDGSRRVAGAKELRWWRNDGSASDR